MFKKLKNQNDQIRLFATFKKDQNERVKLLKLRLGQGPNFLILNCDQDIKYHEHLKAKVKRKKFSQKEVIIEYLLDDDLKKKYIKDKKFFFNGKFLQKEGTLFFIFFFNLYIFFFELINLFVIFIRW